MGLGSVRGRKEKDALAWVAQTAELHDLPLADERRDRETVRHPLAEGGEIGLEAVGRLGTAKVPAKAGDHLVEDEQGAVPRTELSHALEEAGYAAAHHVLPRA